MEEELKNEWEAETRSEQLPAPAPKKEKAGYTFYIVIGLVFALILGFRIWFSNSFGRVEVSGASMNQTLQDGDVLFMRLVRDGKGLERGDVIVVDVSGYPEVNSGGKQVQFLIKRLIAIEGDKLRCRDGQISICYAGTAEYVPLDEPYAYYDGVTGKDAYDYDFKEYTVGEGEIFFLGDNRHNSVDSRYQELGGSHLKGSLYKATDVHGVVSQWAIDNMEFLDMLFFL